MVYLRRSIYLLAVFMLGCSSADNENDAGIIVSADWLSNRMGSPSLLVFHVGSQEVYDSIHIQGARFLDPYEFTVSSEGLSNQLPAADSLRTLLGQMGMDVDSEIVLYYENDRMITRTARVFMTLDYAGLGDRTHVLNGGLDSWLEKEQHRAANQGTAKVKGSRSTKKEEQRTDVTGMIGDKKVTITADEVNRHKWDPGYVVVDSRSADEYYGEIDSTGQVGTRGHIEGAYFLDYHLLLTDSSPQRIKNEEEILMEFKKAGLERGKTAVFYCGSGVRASLSYLVARHMGYPALLYDGSIQEWEELGLPQTSPVIESTWQE